MPDVSGGLRPSAEANDSASFQDMMELRLCSPHLLTRRQSNSVISNISFSIVAMALRLI